MTAARPPLVVTLYGRHVADVVDAGVGYTALHYTETAVAEPIGAQLSLSLPVRAETYPGAGVASRWVRSLLPEGRALAWAVQVYGIPEDDRFGLLAVLGADVAGAARHPRQTARRGRGQLLAPFDRRPRLPRPASARARPRAGPGARCPSVACRASGQGRASSGRRRLLPADRGCPVVGRPQAGARCPYRGGPHRPGHERALLSDLGASGWPRCSRGRGRAVRRHPDVGHRALRPGARRGPSRTTASRRPPERDGARPVAQVRGAACPARGS